MPMSAFMFYNDSADRLMFSRYNNINQVLIYKSYTTWLGSKTEQEDGSMLPLVKVK